MSNLFYLPRQRSEPGAKLYFRLTGTSTPQAIYTDIDLTTPASNPQVADADGYFDPIYLDPSLPNYRVIHTDGSNVDDDPTLEVQLEPTLDDVPSSSNVSSGYRVRGTSPAIFWEETDGSLNNKIWRARVAGEVLTIAIGDDAESTFTDVVSITRAGVVTIPDLVTDAGSFTGTLTGMTTTVTRTVYYQVSDGYARLWIKQDATGTSNSTSMNLTGIPAALRPSNTRICAGMLVVDNGAITTAAYAGVTGAGEVQFSFTFTGSGTKGLKDGWTIGYPL